MLAFVLEAGAAEVSREFQATCVVASQATYDGAKAMEMAETASLPAR